MDRDENRGPVWGWIAGIIALIVVAILVVPLLFGDRTQDFTPGDFEPGIGGAPGEEGTIRDVSTIVQAQDPAELEGRRVELSNVTVQTVLGDTGFWVGTQAGQILVVTKNGDDEDQTRAVAGQTVNVNGTVRRMPSIEDMQSMWGLTAEQASALQNQRVYIDADDVREAE